METTRCVMRTGIDQWFPSLAVRENQLKFVLRGREQTKLPGFYPDSLNPTLKNGKIYIYAVSPGDSDTVQVGITG